MQWVKIEVRGWIKYSKTLNVSEVYEGGNVFRGKCWMQKEKEKSKSVFEPE